MTQNRTYSLSEFHKNVITLMSGAIIAQIIPFIFSPVLSRIFSVKDFAQLGIFSSIVTITSVVATGKFDYAIMIPKDDDDASTLLFVSFLLSIIYIFVLSFICLIFGNFLVDNTNYVFLKDSLYLIPIAVFTVTSFSTLNYWVTRSKEYKVLAHNKVIKNLTTTSSSILIGFSRIIEGGLIIGQYLGIGISSFILGLQLFKDKRLIKNKLSFKKAKNIIIQYKDFPIFALPHNLMEALSTHMPILLLSGWFSSDVVGGYFFSSKILSIPMILIGSSVAQTFYQEFTDIINSRGDAKTFLLKTWQHLFLIGIIPLTTIFFFGDHIFVFIFGDQWHTAGNISQILSISILFSFISSPTSSTYTVLRKQHISIVFGIIVLIYRPLTLYIGYLYNNFFLGLMLLVAMDLIQIFAFNLLIIKLLNCR